jgi:hypothetical protein
MGADAQLLGRPGTGKDLGWVLEMFRTIELLDVSSFLTYLAPDVRFRFGNAPCLQGPDQVAAAVSHFFTLLRGLRHELVGLWQDGSAVVAEADVTYTRLDGRNASLPVVSLIRLGGPRQVRDYRIYFDPPPIFGR